MTSNLRKTDRQECKELLEKLGTVQRFGQIGPCPRCGYRPMNPKTMLNALSRHADVYICEACGMEEAMLAAAHQEPVPLEDWAMFQDQEPDLCPVRDTFVNAVSDVREIRYTKDVYRLGLAMEQECPDNDCRIFKNIFNMARELDGALDIISGYPATVLQSRLHDWIKELWDMWGSNHAVLAYRAQHGNEGQRQKPMEPWHPGTKEKSGYAAEALTGQGRRQAPPQS